MSLYNPLYNLVWYSYVAFSIGTGCIHVQDKKDINRCVIRNKGGLMFAHWSVMYPYSYNTTPDLLATIRQSLLIKQQNICWTSVLRSPTASACRMKYRYTPQRVYIGPNSGCWIWQRLSDEVRMYDRMSVYRSSTVLVVWRICMFQGVYYMFTIDILLVL